MKRVFSLLIVFVLLISALTMSSSAQEGELVQTGVTVDTVDCRVECPVAGTHPDRYASPDNDEAYTAEIVAWYLNESPYPGVGEKDYFTAGKTYCVRIRYTAKTGYTFDDDTTYYINGERAVYVGGRTYELAMTSYQAAITSGSCTITNPAISHFPDMDPQTDDERFTVSVYYWAKNDGSGRILNENHRFEPLTMYKVAIFFTPKPGYYFTDNAYFYINGKSVEVIPGLHSTCVLEFPKLPNPKYTIYGDLTTYLSETDVATVELCKDDVAETHVAGTTVTGCNGSYSLPNIPFGYYIIKFSKPNHVGRIYGMHVFDEDVRFDMFLCPIGDANLNGKVQSNDAMAVYKHAQGVNEADKITDPYALRCADVNGNKLIQSNDAMKIYQQAQGKHTLY